MIDLLVALWLTNAEAFRTQSIINYAVISASTHNIDSNKFLELISCESRFDEKAKGDWDKEKKFHRAQGILQWHKPSFDSYSKKFGTKGNYYDPFSQIDLAVLVIAKDEKGIKNWWNCGQRIGLIKSKETALAD